MPPRKRAEPKTRWRESHYLGYGVLGFGVFAILAVLVLAFAARDESTVSESAQGLVASLVAPQSVPVPPPKKDYYFRRQPDIDPVAISGVWQSAVGRYTAVLQMDKGVYQIIYASNDPNAPRIYSNGVYRTLEDLIVLTPQLDWPAPTAPAANITYEPMTRAPFPVVVAFQGGRMMWQNPPYSEKRVLTSRSSPLFLGENVDYVTWEKVQR